MKLFLLLVSMLFLGSCETLSPLTTAFSIGEAVNAVHEAEKVPDTIETTVKNTKDGVIIESSNPEYSTVNKETVNGIPVIDKSTYNSLPQPELDIEKGISSIPNWLIYLVIISGLFYFINRVRLYRRLNNDTDGTNNNGRWCSDGGSVQVHGSGTEEQAEADGNDDEGSPTAGRSEERRQRVRIKVRRRSSE